MTNEEKIKEAKRLMIEVTESERQMEIERVNNLFCRCGHTHKEHTKSYSINYSAGFCITEKCDCRNFISAPQQVKELKPDSGDIGMNSRYQYNFNMIQGIKSKTKQG